MVEIAPLGVFRQTPAAAEPAPSSGALRLWAEFRKSRQRLGNADGLPNHQRRDIGLPPRPSEVEHYYSHYVSTGRL